MAERGAEEEQRAMWALGKNRAEAAMDLVGRGVKRNRPEKAPKGSTSKTGRKSKYATEEERKAARREYARRYREKKRKGNSTSETANAPWALVALGDDALVANGQCSMEMGDQEQMGLAEFQGALEEADTPPSEDWDPE